MERKLWSQNYSMKIDLQEKVLLSIMLYEYSTQILQCLCSVNTDVLYIALYLEITCTYIIYCDKYCTVATYVLSAFSSIFDGLCENRFKTDYFSCT